MTAGVLGGTTPKRVTLLASSGTAAVPMIPALA
jgi:hypothetical protein